MEIESFGFSGVVSSRVTDIPGGHGFRAYFANGRGISVVSSIYSYGGPEGYYEIAVLDKSDELDYSTPVANDVVGYLTAANVKRYALEIARLPKENG